MIRRLGSARRLSGTVALPGDKSISHRYAMLAALAEGRSELRNFAASQDCHSTLRCLRALAAPAQPLDAGNSGTTMRLLAGILAGHPFESVLGGDASLSRRPMQR